MSQKLTDQITDLYIDNYNVESFDDDRNMYQADGTTLNIKYNMGDKYLLGGRCDQAAYALSAAKEWRDTAEIRCHQANEDHGAQSLRAQRAQLDLSKAQAKLENAQMFFEIDTNLFYTFTGVIWGGRQRHARQRASMVDRIQGADARRQHRCCTYRQGDQGAEETPQVTCQGQPHRSRC